MAAQVTIQGDQSAQDNSSTTLAAAEYASGTQASVATATTLALTQSTPIAPGMFARLFGAIRPSRAASVASCGVKRPRAAVPLSSAVGVTSPDWEYVSRIAQTSDNRFWAGVVTGTHGGGSAPWGGRTTLAD